MVNLMGYFVIFHCNKLLLRHEMSTLIKAGVHQGELETITYSLKSTGRNTVISEDNELYYRGMLYDVVATIITGDSITFSCIRDKNEQSLISNFTQFLRHHSGFNETKKAKPILALIQHLLTQALVQKTILPLPFPEHSVHFPALIYPFYMVYPAGVSPPPKTAEYTVC